MNATSSTLPLQALQQDLGTRAEMLQQSLAHLHATTASNQDLGEELAEFASLLIFQMLQSMRKTIPKSGLLHQGFAHDLYTSFYDQEVARHIARRGSLGLTSLLAQQFKAETGEQHASGMKQAALTAYQKQLPQHTGIFSLPVHGHLSSPFGSRQDPFDQEEKHHHGIDIAAPAGSLIRAAAPGTISFSGTQPGYGNLVIITHPDGYQTYYAHNAENLVDVGDEVKQAQPIARLGQTGRATGAHLHFEIRRNGRALNPMALLKDGTPQQKNS